MKTLILIIFSIQLMACGGSTDTAENSSNTSSDNTLPVIQFNAISNASTSTEYTSNTVVINGSNSSYSISITDGSYSVDNQAFTTATSLVNNGSSIRVRHTSSGFNGVSTYTILSIDDSSNSTFTTTTQAGSIAFSASPFTPLRTVNVNDANSLQNALLSVMPGDDIVLADGVYTAANSGLDPDAGHARFAGAFYPAVSGDSNNPIRIRAANPGNARLTIAPNPADDGAILSVGGRSYIIISGLVFDAEVTAIRQDTGFVTVSNSSYIYFENNIINGVAPSPTFQNNHANLYLQNVTNSRFANNLIRNISNNGGSHDGEGIIMYGVNQSVFEFNTSSNIGGPAIYLKGDREVFNEENNYGNTVRYNYASQCKIGIMVTANGQFNTTRSLIYQNLSDTCERGVHIHGWSNLVDVFNNTAVNNNAADGNEYTGGIVIAAITPDEGTNIRIWGNLVYGVSAQYDSWLQSLGYHHTAINYTSDYNWLQTGLRQKQNLLDYINLQSAQASNYELNSLEGSDPFVDYVSGNYRLHDQNYTEGAFVPDTAGIYDNTVLPGCYITGNEQIGRL